VAVVAEVGKIPFRPFGVWRNERRDAILDESDNVSPGTQQAVVQMLADRLALEPEWFIGKQRAAE